MIILVAEDDPQVRRSLVRMLTIKGHVPHEAMNGTEALKLLDDGLVPDLIISDLEMHGGLSGAEFCTELRKKEMAGGKFTPFLLVSGNSHVAEIAAHCGATDFGRKAGNATDKVNELLESLAQS